MHASSLPRAFLASLERNPDKTLLDFEGQRVSYQAMHQHVRSIAGSLQAWGLQPGERVALYLENSPSFVASYLAVLWLGGIIVPINTRYRESELRHIVNDAQARLLVTDTQGMSAVTALRHDLPSVEALLELQHDLEADRQRWQALAPADTLPEALPLNPEAIAVIGYTSGTTGRSKGAMLSHGNFCSNSAAVTQAWGWSADDQLLLVLPLFHMHGLGVGLHGTLLQGSSISLMRKFEADTVYARLCQGDISMFFGVPTMYGRLLQQATNQEQRPKGLRLLVSGSAPLSAQLHADIARAFGHRILERYGMTETVMNLGNPLDGERRAGSVGFPFPGVEVRVADPITNSPLATGQSGEIQLRGANICRGYWQQPEASAEVWSADAWFKTGDLGYCDAEGYYYLNGRAKELIISGGFNVYPREVEEVLEQHPNVHEVAVLGMPDPDLGEKVVAAVVADAAIADAASLRDFCKDHIAGFKVPKTLYYVEALPRNALGKVQKHILRDKLETDSSAHPPDTTH